VYYGAYIPLGVGLNINFFNEGRLFINSTYRVPITTGTSNYHFMYAFGVSGRLTKKKEPKVIPPPPPPPPPKDSDNDGINDDNDKCPTVAGVAKYQGCPVPDTDKDGINDDNDKCPTVAGLAKYEGCPVPDTDKDGINDEEDKCPNQAGVARYQGCPVPDADGDGVNDEEDKCPKVAGPADNFGCPVIGIKSYEIVFKTGSAILLAKGKPILDTVVAYLKRNPDVEVTIDGNTDNTGSDKVNNPLSLKRAEATKKYLVSKEINADRLVTAGFGSTQPVADNKTAEGRKKNRRIEIKIKG
jgi:outer membrane protein OmpA-like peptidoglycan-associated protein